MENLFMNRIFLALAGLSLASMLTGCVATTYKHEIAIVRDSDGKVIQTIETEGIEQPAAGSLPPYKFKHLELPK
jgi:hypothetical protein